jgi:hypothetical protein
VKAQKVDKKTARYLEFRKMIDTADFTIILEKAFPPSAGASATNANTIDLSGAPAITVSHGLMTCDIPHFSSQTVGQEKRLSFSTANFIYQAEKTGKPDDKQYNVVIMPKGTNDFGNNIKQFIISVVNDDLVSVLVTFTDQESAGYQGYIEKAKK